MESGDGLVVRIRPHAGRLTPIQAKGIADLANRFGNGLIDLSNRANVQLRGVSLQTHTPLITGLRALGLIDKSESSERQRNVILTPFWGKTDGAPAMAGAVAAALSGTGAPVLPSKFGAAIDIGAVPVLRCVSCDIRIERLGDQFLIYPDGAAVGVRVMRNACADTVRALAQWFLDNGGMSGGRGRMADLIARGAALPAHLDTAVPPAPVFAAVPMLADAGAMVGIQFGQMQADTLAKLADLWPLRITPWRMLLLEGARAIPQIAGLITDPTDPMLRVIACVGAPACKQGLGDTRNLARTLAGTLARTLGDGQRLHITGCAKNCAHPTSASLTITATASGYDISGANPQSGLTPDQLAQTIRMLPHAP
jgi:precorrin-3B synthase